MLLPGSAHPHPRRLPAELAVWLGVSETQVRGWMEAGLPAPGGLLDAFQTTNWLSDRLDQAPVLRARWRRYLRWFEPFVNGSDRAVTRNITRHHRLFLPHQPHTLQWWVPRIPGEIWNVPTSTTATHVRLEVAQATATAIVECVPHHYPQPDLVAVVEEVVSGFTYGYRHHRAHDEYHGRSSGSCIDLAFALGDRLTERGRAWRLCVGVVAHTALANPHFWLEVEVSGGGWATVDPSLPAIAKTFSALHTSDWRQWVRAYTGGCDARRIVLLRGESPLTGIPEGATVGSLIGEVVADGHNAWACLDWVCGECRWEFG